MKRRCKHEFMRMAFRGDPTIYNNWQCEIEEKCCKCSIVKHRTPTQGEYLAEVTKLTCAKCGAFLKDHNDKDCLVMLVERVKSLEERLECLERWKNG